MTSKKSTQYFLELNSFRFFFLLSIILLITWFIYDDAMPGQFLFDESSNLSGLAKVRDYFSAVSFVFSNNSGPLGRPVGVATFLFQHSAWPNHPEQMLAVNFAIHLIAIFVASILAIGLARLQLPEEKNKNLSLWIGCGVAILWGLSPFLATTHLMIIQRFTSLSGLFVLAGLSAFVWSYLIAPRHPRRASLLLLVGLGGGTLLATLSKENGALLPLLALITLWLWIPRAQRPRTIPYRAILMLFAVIPGILVIGYIVSRVPGIIEHGYGEHRYFTPEQRLMSQPAILMDYLRNLLLPRAFSVSPFMDRLPAPSGWLNPPIMLLGLLFWIGLLALGANLRHRFPALLFGLLFFLTGHLLESSIFGLELYFAHRNYIPSFGIYFAVVFAITMVPSSYKKAAVLALSTYGILFALVLWLVTSTWRDPGFAAERWVIENPHSERAVQFLANQYLRVGDPWSARKIFDEAAQRYPDRPVIQIQRTQFCRGREDQFPELLSEVAMHLRAAPFQSCATRVLAMEAQGTPALSCFKRDHTALAIMADALIENKPYTEDPLSYSNLLFTKAMASHEADDIEKAISLMMQAFDVYPHLDTAFYAATFMSNLGQHDRVLNYLAEIRQRAPANPFKRTAWIGRVDDFIALVNDAQKMRDATSSEPR